MPTVDNWRALVERLQTEADLCRNEGAEDIAALLDEAVKGLQGMAAEVQALRGDAERYRWLRQNPTWLGWDADFRPDEVEREVDAARGKPAQHCTYPDCRCPFDAPADPNWCAKGLPRADTGGEA